MTVDQDKGKAEKNALTTAMLLVLKIAVHTGFLGGNLGFTSGFTEAQKIIISEFVIFCPRIFSETRREIA